jgi:hypothetical protein
MVWADILGILVVALLALVVHLIPIYHRGRTVLYHLSRNGTSEPLDIELLYPKENPPIPSWTCGVVNFIIPIVVIAIFQFKIKSVWDFHTGMTGTLKALVATYVLAPCKFLM